MWIGILNTSVTVPSLPGQGNPGPPQPFESTEKFLFDGNNGFLRSVTQTNYRFTDEVTLSCWVTFGSFLFGPGFKNHMIIDQAKTNNTTGYSLYVTRGVNAGESFLRFQVGKNQATPFPAADYRAQIRIDNITDVQSKKFYIMAAVKDDTIRLNLKSDGVNLTNTKALSNTDPIFYNVATNAFCIGNTSPNNTNEFDGNIDEVGVFNEYLNNANANDIFNWNQNGNLETYSIEKGGLNLEAWYRMGENATYTPNTETYNVLTQDDDNIITEGGINVVTEAFTENLGVWRLKNAVALNDNTKDLVSSKVGDDLVGFLPENAETQPGIPPI